MGGNGIIIGTVILVTEFRPLQGQNYGHFTKNERYLWTILGMIIVMLISSTCYKLYMIITQHNSVVKRS